mgnify:CR=1 FL=1
MVPEYVVKELDTTGAQLLLQIAQILCPLMDLPVLV